MRAPIAWAAATLGLALLAAAPAQAAPTCLDRDGVTVRCGTPGAMPVGWTPPPGTPDPADDSPAPGLAELAGLAAVLGGLFALLALMPEFDGWDGGERDED
ncbi:MAG TPA: hypothetical protein VFH92_11665 [Phenylobacterium sp.]|nr:hypothetical protein [Phenylobacterium sp.]